MSRSTRRQIHLVTSRRTARDAHGDSPKQSRTSCPVVYESEGTVVLHFDMSSRVQSEMRESAPDDLALGYTRTMMGFLALNRQPKHIGIIGLGGGSIAKYCYRNLPHSVISVAEISPEVIALRDRFRIPRDDHRLEVFCMDGVDFVEGKRGLFDALLVDGFDRAGQPPELCSQAFYDACYSALTVRGVLVVNACDGSLSRLINRINGSFQNRIIVAGSNDSFNQILFAGKGRVFRKVTRVLQRIEDLATSLEPASTPRQALTMRL